MKNNSVYLSTVAAAERIISLLPSATARELAALAISRRDFYETLSEIRIRCEGTSIITQNGECVALLSRVGRREFLELFDRVTDGAIYSHRETLREGYIPLGDGIRLGVCGDYSHGELQRPSALVFRMPSVRCECAETLYTEWANACDGMLIFSGAGGGKTSALRALGALIAQRQMLHTVAIDERYEFLPEDSSELELLRGYGKARGMEMAKRVLGADVVLVDEIGTLEESEAILSVGRGGCSVIATAHAGNYSELIRSRAIAPLIESEYFSVIAELRLDDGVRSVDITYPSRVKA